MQALVEELRRAGRPADALSGKPALSDPLRTRLKNLRKQVDRALRPKLG